MINYLRATRMHRTYSRLRAPRTSMLASSVDKQKRISLVVELLGRGRAGGS